MKLNGVQVAGVIVDEAFHDPKERILKTEQDGIVHQVDQEAFHDPKERILELFLSKQSQVTVTAQAHFRSCNMLWAVTVTFAGRY